MLEARETAGEASREWRQRRRLGQLDLSATSIFGTATAIYGLMIEGFFPADEATWAAFLVPGTEAHS